MYKPSAKFAYSVLRSTNRTEHRSLAKFRDLGFHVIWLEVWASLHLWRYVHPVQDTAWLSFHGIIPPADHLVRFGMQVDLWCCCGLPEDLIHLFSACQFAQACLEWFLPLLRRFKPSLSRLSTSEILFGFPKDSGILVAFSALLSDLRHQVWLVRNASISKG